MKLAIAVIAAALALAAPAAASNVTNPKMPKPERHRIAPPTSLGGISLGDDLEAANEAWGGQGLCDSRVLPDSCFWGDFYDNRDGRAEIEAPEGIVDWVSIAWSGCCGGRKPDVRQGVARFKTKEGIHLGSKLADVGRAYPDAEPIEHGWNDRIQAYVVSDGESGIVFGGGKFVNYINLFED
jgi:hypothetical protein